MILLVTGGAGFIGSNLAEALVKRRYKVRVLDNFSTGKIENIKPFLDKIELIKGDIRDLKILRKSLEGVKYVFHQAALRSVPRSVEDPLSTNEVNITGTLQLLLESKNAGVKRVVYASSSSVYGDSKHIPQKETDAPSPISPYAVSKLAAENYCQVFAKTLGLETVSLRYFNVFGPKQDPESKYAAVIPKFIKASLNGDVLEIHGDGKQSRDFTYVQNVVNANILAAFTPKITGQVFNIACNRSHSILHIAQTINKILGIKNPKIIHTPARPGDVRKTCADITKAKNLLGYKVEVDFEQGLKNTIVWMQNIKNYNL